MALTTQIAPSGMIRFRGETGLAVEVWESLRKLQSQRLDVLTVTKANDAGICPAPAFSLTRQSLHDTFSIMRTAKVADLRNRFAEVSAWIASGESVTILKRGTPFAVLAPLRKPKPAAPKLDRMARLRRIFPDGPARGDISESIDYDRGNT